MALERVERGSCAVAEGVLRLVCGSFLGAFNRVHRLVFVVGELVEVGVCEDGALVVFGIAFEHNVLNGGFYDVLALFAYLGENVHRLCFIARCEAVFVIICENFLCVADNSVVLFECLGLELCGVLCGQGYFVYEDSGKLNVMRLLHHRLGLFLACVNDMRHRLVHNVEDAEQDKERKQHTAAAAHRIVALLLKLLKLLLLLFLIVLVFRLDFLYLRCEDSGFRGVLLLLYRERKHRKLYDKREQQDSYSDVFTDKIVDEVEDITQRGAD